MKLIYCEKCGGDMRIAPFEMKAVCAYCGHTYALSREDTDYYLDYYREMGHFLKANKSEQERMLAAAKLWENALTETFECKDGRNIEIHYLHKVNTEVGAVYTAKDAVLIHFNEGKIFEADWYRNMVSKLDYPSADVRSLSDFFPTIVGGFELLDGGRMIAVKKNANEYPLKLFGELHPRHVAWVISRLENIACVLEYSNLVHPAINEDSIFINPYDHQAMLYSGWWMVAGKGQYTVDRKGIAKSKDTLACIRELAARLLGFENAKAVTEKKDLPKPFVDFLHSEPCDSAYDDFGYWDEVLIQSYGERKFMVMDVDDDDIYR